MPKAKYRHKRTMAMRSISNGVEVSTRQFRSIFRKGFKSHPGRWREHGSDAVRIAQDTHGIYWAEWRGSAVFWASAWYEIPTIVGERARKIDEFVKELA